jgi:hypothetical protein
MIIEVVPRNGDRRPMSTSSRTRTRRVDECSVGRSVLADVLARDVPCELVTLLVMPFCCLASVVILLDPVGLTASGAQASGYAATCLATALCGSSSGGLCVDGGDGRSTHRVIQFTLRSGRARALVSSCGASLGALMLLVCR